MVLEDQGAGDVSERIEEEQSRPLNPMASSLLPDSPGNTPISEDEIGALIPNLATRAELNKWEAREHHPGREMVFSPAS